MSASASAIAAVRVEGGEALQTENGEWQVAWTTARGERTVWAGDQTRLRALARLLAAATAQPGGERTTGGPWAEIQFKDGTHVRLEFGHQPFGGRIGVSVTPAGDGEQSVDTWNGLCDAALMDLFASGSVPWLSTAAMPGVPLDPARIEIDSASDQLELDRLGSRWVMREPLQAECESELVKLAARQLAALSGDRLLDDPELHAAPAIASWTVTDARRGGRTWRAELLTTIDATHVAVRCDVASGEGSDQWGPVVFAMELSEAERIDADPASYLSRTTLRAAAGDIAVLGINAGSKRMQLVRSPEGGWRDEQDAEHFGAVQLAALLTELPAAAAVLTSAVDGAFGVNYEIEASPRGESGASFTVDGPVRIGLLTTSGGARLAIEHRGVLRVYAGPESQTVWQWLLGLQLDRPDPAG